MKHISSQLYQYLQSVQAYIAPPVTAVFVIGILSKRVSAKGAIASLFTGFILGMLRLLLEINKAALPDIALLNWFVGINFLHFAVLLFLVCCLVLVGVSLLTLQAPDEKLEGLTFQTPRKEVQKGNRQDKAMMLLTFAVVGVVIVIWIYFTG